MRIKSDFVTNSSSVSYSLDLHGLKKKKLTEEQRVKLVEMKLTNWEGLGADVEEGLIYILAGDRDEDDLEDRMSEIEHKLGVLEELFDIDS